ncbi:hypothetical protein BDW02DRAFT_570989 [Decorospora gaudefroyi]|uniref:Glycosyltransferase family 31 protein n=1 Tax=Decorospora gaudefroyi TaxID=184978 RepID=A0A6A5K4C3_9PLEO|nr:hypothetical protein BDW02DRAFT_571816 [Decorospora gaudefroyi]KAF1832511.1 hypothetical protein BDW02DRAFT_570989 [Decorospora gaudefroyi]
MPLLTPSRLAIILVSCSLLSFFWTFGLSQQSAQPEPVLPIIDHYEHKNVHSEPLIPRPVIDETYATAPTPTPTAHGERPAESDDGRWNGKATQSGKTPGPTETGIAEFEEDGGRWEDKDKQGEGGKSGKTHAISATLLKANPVASNAHVMNATAVITSAAAPTHTLDKFCKDAQGAEHVMIILRTSKAEIGKLSTHLRNLLACVPSYAIFSDHAAEFQGHPVHDALESVSRGAKRKHAEFQEYRIMDSDTEHTPDPKKMKELEKWKFLPMVYKAYHMNPSARFFVLIEAETALSWANLLQWTSRLDYRIPYYSGARGIIAGTKLAQRGPGILLSQGALRQYSKAYDELYTSKWEPSLGKECCGDLMLAKAMTDAHVELYSSWPLLQGEQPHTLDFSKKVWCAPAVSWHHMDAEQLDVQWGREKNWTKQHGWSKPYLFRDAFHDYIHPHLAPQKANWDNLSSDTKIIAPKGRQQALRQEANRLRKIAKEEQAWLEREKMGSFTRSLVAAAPRADKEKDKDKEKGKEKEKAKEKQPPNWDKLAEKFAHAADSSQTCAATCEDVEDCLQWRYTDKGDGECHLGKVLRLGAKKEEGKEKDEGMWKSGWLVDRIESVTKSWACKKVEWRFYQ